MNASRKDLSGPSTPIKEREGINNNNPRGTNSIPLTDGRVKYYLDMGKGKITQDYNIDYQEHSLIFYLKGEYQLIDLENFIDVVKNYL